MAFHLQAQVVWVYGQLGGAGDCHSLQLILLPSPVFRSREKVGMPVPPRIGDRKAPGSS